MSRSETRDRLTPPSAATSANFRQIFIVLVWEPFGGLAMNEVVVAVYRSASAAEVAVEDLKVARFHLQLSGNL